MGLIKNQSNIFCIILCIAFSIYYDFIEFVWFTLSVWVIFKTFTWLFIPSFLSYFDFDDEKMKNSKTFRFFNNLIPMVIILTLMFISTF
jgi:hypothetical protein